MNTNTAVAKRIYKFLSEKNMTQYQLEKRTGIAHGNMDAILREKNKTVTLKNLILIARAFDMTVSEFLNDELFERDDLEL